MMSTIAVSQTDSKSEDWYRKYYHIQIGNLRFHATRVHFRGIKSDETKSDTVKMYNNWGETMTFDFRRVPDCITAEAIPSSLEPGEEGVIVVTYDAAMNGKYGPVYANFILVTNDTLVAEKRIIASPDIQEDFSAWTEEELANAPKITFEDKDFHFDTVAQGTKVKHSFIFRNDGKSDLIIRKTKSSCGCTATEPAKTTLLPGESSKIDIIFNTSGRKGKQHKSVTVIANDPENPKTILNIGGIIRTPDE